jgi:signal transduction histidine kinase
MNRLRLFTSVRWRAAAGAALATLLILGLGAWWMRDVVRHQWMTAAEDEAYGQAGTITTDINAGIDAGDGITASYVIVLADGRWASPQGSFNDFTPVRSRPYLPPFPNESQFGTVRFPAHVSKVPGKVPDGPSVENRTVKLAADVTDVLSPAKIRKATELAGQRRQRLTVYVMVSPEDADTATSAAGNIFGWGLPLAVPFVALVAWLATGRALRPVEAIRKRMAEISGHSLDQRVPVPPSGDEITRLAETTNSTLDRLEHALSQQRRFVADASHELRSPLANLRSALEIPLVHPEGVDWPTVVSEALADTARIQRLADDLLLLASSRDTPPAQFTDLTNIVEEQIAERSFTNGHGPAFTAGISGPALVPGNEIHLGRVIRNLLDNAARHARAEVTAAVTVSGENVILTVTDDGPGIPIADRERIFDRFVRLDDARDRAAGGTGLGLAIVRDLVGGLGGTVTAADSPAGARFVVQLPRHDDAHEHTS